MIVYTALQSQKLYGRCRQEACRLARLRFRAVHSKRDPFSQVDLTPEVVFWLHYACLQTHTHTNNFFPEEFKPNQQKNLDIEMSCKVCNSSLIHPWTFLTHRTRIIHNWWRNVSWHRAKGKSCSLEESLYCFYFSLTITGEVSKKWNEALNLTSCGIFQKQEEVVTFGLMHTVSLE